MRPLGGLAMVVGLGRGATGWIRAIHDALRMGVLLIGFGLESRVAQAFTRQSPAARRTPQTTSAWTAGAACGEARRVQRYCMC